MLRIVVFISPCSCTGFFPPLNNTLIEKRNRISHKKNTHTNILNILTRQILYYKLKYSTGRKIVSLGFNVFNSAVFFCFYCFISLALVTVLDLDGIRTEDKSKKTLKLKVDVKKVLYLRFLPLLRMFLCVFLGAVKAENVIVSLGVCTWRRTASPRPFFFCTE